MAVVGRPNAWEKSRKPSEPKECQYCEDPARYGLGPSFPQRTEKYSGLDKVIQFTYWHEELHQDCRDFPKKRIRCQLSR